MLELDQNPLCFEYRYPCLSLDWGSTRNSPLELMLTPRQHHGSTRLDRLVQEGTLELVDHSDWAAPIIAVLKPDKKSVRICGDFLLTVNPVFKLNLYPIPKVDDLFTTLQAVHQARPLPGLPTVAPGGELQTVRRHQYPEGVVPVHTPTTWPLVSTRIVQRVMNNLLKGILKITVYLDDILIASDTKAEHLQTIKAVLSKL